MADDLVRFLFGVPAAEDRDTFFIHLHSRLLQFRVHLADSLLERRRERSDAERFGERRFVREARFVFGAGFGHVERIVRLSGRLNRLNRLNRVYGGIVRKRRRDAFERFRDTK